MGNPKDFAPNHIGTQSKKLVEIKESKCKDQTGKQPIVDNVKEKENITFSFLCINLRKDR